MKRRIFTLIFLGFVLVSFSQNDTLYYSVVNIGKITGGQKVWQKGPNEFHYTYQFNDRGRGDSMSTVIHTNADGLINSLDATGIDYFKNPYTEKFAVTGDSATWVINGEKRTLKFNQELYAANTAPAIYELLIKWIAKQPKKRVAIIPEGYIHLDEAILKTITWKNKTLKLKLFPIYYEPASSPSYIWMTNDMHFFATVSSWSSHIARGYESWTDSLFSLQETESQTYYANELQHNSKSFSGHALLTHCTVFQAAEATALKDMTVELNKGKIVAVFPSALKKENSKFDTVIDCKGKFLMPGLWDMHGHYSKDEGGVYLAGGVTHIRDMGNNKIVVNYKQQIRANKLLGPDISYLSGFIDKEDPFEGPTGKMISSLSEGIKAIDEYHAMGCGQIKLYSAIKPAWVAPLAAHAHSLGMKVCGHIPAFMTAEQAIKAGYDEITHMNFIFLNFMGDTIDTRTPARFRLVGSAGGKLDVQSKKVLDFISLMKKKQVALDPTLNVWQGMFEEFKGDTSGYLKPIVKWLPESWLPGLAIKSPFGNEANKEAYKAAFSNMLKMLKQLYDQGILLVAGTDGGEANALHHELELYVRAGIPANQALKIATYNAALDCKLQNVYGEIKAGREADFILIDGNPMVNISDVRRIELVIKNNRLYQPKQILQSQGWKYYY